MKSQCSVMVKLLDVLKKLSFQLIPSFCHGSPTGDFDSVTPSQPNIYHGVAMGGDSTTDPALSKSRRNKSVN